jgi:hypothetical protein
LQQLLNMVKRHVDPLDAYSIDELVALIEGEASAPPREAFTLLTFQAVRKASGQIQQRLTILNTFQKFAAPHLASQRGVKSSISIHSGGELTKENRGMFNFPKQHQVRPRTSLRCGRARHCTNQWK